MQKLLTFFFSKNISVYVIFNDESFNDRLTNNWAQNFTQSCKTLPCFRGLVKEEYMNIILALCFLILHRKRELI